MCAIFGIIGSTNYRLLKKMSLCQLYRGPDAQSFLVNKKNNFSIGMNRLSVIDKKKGKQPMFSHDKKYLVIFNGAIYNFIELRNYLLKKKITFKTNSDTEVIINAYSYWGNKCFNYFDGMWAVGIYDFENKKFEAVIDNFEKIKINEKDIGIFITKNQLLGKSYDQIGDYDKAYNCFLNSNNVINKIFGNRYKKEIYINIIKERINFYRNFKLNSWGSISSSNNDPIFLVGFPRSGTTLLDTILRSHKSIDVIEEKPIVDKLIENLKLETENNLLNLENLNKKSCTKIKELYLKTRGEYAKSNNEKIYIDKLPLNFIYIGEIIRLFPKAKFIFALRNPYDVILSCFMQQFTPNDSMMNFINLKDSANFYDISMKLYKMYFELFKSNIYEIKYEDVIQNFDDTIKKLLNFLNLEWEDEVQKFYKTARERGIISTPSYNQINKPLYQKSIQRWKNYEKNFAEIDTDLNFWKNEFKY